MPRKKLYSKRLDMPIHQIQTICKVTRSTVLRWEREGFPYVEEKLCRLVRDGRIMPDKWTHGKFNQKGNLELYSGEVRENDILNIPYMRELAALRTRLMKELGNENDQLKEKINALDTSAANDYFY